MDTPRPAWRTALAPSLIGAGALTLLQALATVAEARRAGLPGDGFAALLRSAAFYPPWIAFGVGLYAALDGRPLRDPRTALGAFVAAFGLFLVPYAGYEAASAAAQAGQPWSSGFSPFATFVDFVLFTGAFAAVYGAALARAELDRERAAHRVEAEVMALRLQVERHRLASLQAQLEPHFLFNALNAVAGLVRAGARADALRALGQLGALLRYASAASRTEWVGLDEEIAFVDAYLALQRLRYGPRLQVRVHTDGDPGEIRCPPLVLQPLIENAIRHDLEVHDGDGQLALDVVVGEDGAAVRVENPVRAGRPPNPGLGLGLASVAERLAVRFPAAPPLEAGVHGDRFVVRLTIPRIDDGA